MSWGAISVGVSAAVGIMGMDAAKKKQSFS